MHELSPSFRYKHTYTKIVVHTNVILNSAERSHTHTLCLCTCIVHNFKVKYIFNVARMLEQCECQTFLYVWRAQHTHTYMHGKKNENEGNGMLQMPFVYLSIDMQRCILTPAKCFLRRLIERWNNMDFKSTLNIVLLPIFTFSNIGQTL